MQALREEADAAVARAEEAERKLKTSESTVSSVRLCLASPASVSI